MGLFTDWHPLETDLEDALYELEAAHWADRPALLARVEHLQKALAWCKVVRPNYKDEAKPWWHWRKKSHAHPSHHAGGYYHSSQHLHSHSLGTNKLTRASYCDGPRQYVPPHAHHAHTPVAHTHAIDPVYHHGQAHRHREPQQAAQVAHLAAKVHQLEHELGREKDKRRVLLHQTVARPPLRQHHSAGSACRVHGHHRYAATMEPHHSQVHWC